MKLMYKGLILSWAQLADSAGALVAEQCRKESVLKAVSYPAVKHDQYSWLKWHQQWCSRILPSGV